MSQEDVIKKIKAYLKALKQEGIPVEKAYLYGSHARRQANESSDIDVMLVSGVFDTNDDYILSRPWLFTSEIDYRIEPLAIGSKRFHTDDVSPVIEIVRREGIEIVL